MVTKAWSRHSAIESSQKYGTGCTRNKIGRDELVETQGGCVSELGKSVQTSTSCSDEEGLGWRERTYGGERPELDRM